MHPWHEPSVINGNRATLWKMLSKKLMDNIIECKIDGPVTIAERCRFIVEPLKLGGVINNIQSVTTDQPYNDYSDLYFHSRNFAIINPREDCIPPKRISEEELTRLHDLSAFKKHYLTPTEVITDEDVSDFLFPRSSSGGCTYCRLAK
jgi:hypothetical protein